MAKSDSISILLVRVGETPWDDTHRLAGATDLPLSDGGVDELGELCRGLNGPLLHAVVCGPDEASMATSSALAEHRGGKVKRLESLGEVCLGLWEGRLVGELEEKFPRAFGQWMDDPGSVIPPEGEPLVEARERLVCGVVRLLDKARPDAGEGIALVLKPLAMGVVRAAIEDAPSRRVFELSRQTPQAEWMTISRAGLRGLRERARARATRA